MRLDKNAMVEKVINILLNILIFIFGIILLFSIYTGVQTKVLRHDYTDFFGYSVFEVQTGSMATTINPGDWIIVKLTQQVEINDIITYKLNREYVTHRVIEAYKSTYVTMGDANNGKDDPIDQSQIIGKVINILHNFGIIRKTLFNPSVIVALIITLLLFNLAFVKNKSGNKEKKGLIFDVLINKITLLISKSIKKFTKEKKQDKKIEVQEVKEEKAALQEEEKPASEKEEYSEDDLEKTSLFRMISIGSNGTPEKYEEIKEEFEKAENNKEYTEEDLEKTSLFRIISVDANNVDETLLEIAENELNEQNRQEKLKARLEAKNASENVEEEDDETLTNVELELLKNKNVIRKGRNIIDTVMSIKKEEINEIISCVVLDDKIVPNKLANDGFLDSYISIKYYNQSTSKEIEASRISLLKIKKAINDAAVLLIKNYKGKDSKFNEIVAAYTNIFLLVGVIDHAKYSLSEIKVKREFYKKEILKYDKELDESNVEKIVNGILDIQKKYDTLINYILKKLETNMFELKENQLKKNIYAVNLEHNISFSKVYSEYIVDKIYKEGVVAEDKTTVLLNLLSVRLIQDMILSDFNKKYIFHMPSSMYAKEKKYEKLLKIIENDYAKENVYILIKYTDLIGNKLLIKKFRKMGYKFALVIEKNTLIKDKDRNSMYSTDYIFIGRKDSNLTSIPEELRSNIIYEDIVEKIGGFGGE